MRKIKNTFTLILACLIVGLLASGITFIAMKISERHRNLVELDKLETMSETIADEDVLVPEQIVISVEKLKEMLAPAGELVSSKYYYTNVASVENYKELFGYKIPLTTEHTVFSYDGIISGGIDMNAIQYDVDNDNKKIVITLPLPRVISNEIDTSSFKFYDVIKSVFTEISPGEFTGTIDDLKRSEESKLVVDNEFYTQVSENAQKVLQSMLTMSEAVKGYDIQFVTTQP